jgi:glycerol uptake facilitator-like aquaporin
LPIHIQEPPAKDSAYDPYSTLDLPESEPVPFTIARLVVSEFIGTAMLLAAVVGSGIMAERLANGNVAIALLANAIATGGALLAIILAFSPISGAHLNPVVSFASAISGQLRWSRVPAYILAQCGGALAGVFTAHLMFGLPLITLSLHQRSGAAQMFSEFIATFGLLAVIFGCAKAHPSQTPYAVAAYITGAYWFTASTSFANPAVTMARTLTNTFAGIRPHDAPGFVIAQILGALVAIVLFRWLNLRVIKPCPT